MEFAIRVLAGLLPVGIFVVCHADPSLVTTIVPQQWPVRKSQWPNLILDWNWERILLIYSAQILSNHPCLKGKHTQITVAGRNRADRRPRSEVRWALKGSGLTE
jgi:hypothetical protein